MSHREIGYAFGRDALAIAASDRPRLPGAIHAANCTTVLALIADEPDAVELGAMLGLGYTAPVVVEHERTQHYRAHLLPAALTCGRMI